MIDFIVSYACAVNRTYHLYKDEIYEAICSIPDLFRAMSEH